MAEFPKTFNLPDQLSVISAFSMASIGGCAFQNNSAVGAAWPTANRAIFIPFRLSRPMSVTTLWSLNNTSSGNIDLGIYSADGTKIVSTGSTAEVGATAIQTITIATTQLGAGLFYMAMAINTTGANQIASTSSNAQILKMVGMAQMSSAFPLPATATFETVASAYIPFIGLTGRSVV